MNRRSFLRSAGAASLLPVLPMRVAAAPSLPALATPKAHWAALFARVNNRATPELIQKWLGVGVDQAHMLMQDLVAKGIVHAPVAGSAAAVKPILPANTPSSPLPQMSDIRRQVADTVKDWIDAEDSEEAAPVLDPTPEEDAVELHQEPTDETS